MKREGSVLEVFHPAVRRWFSASFAAPTPAQELGWPLIAWGENALILAPTGSGKTLAAFLFAINDLITLGEKGAPTDGVHTLYLSPLEALAADTERNLIGCLSGIRQAAMNLGRQISPVSIGVRTAVEWLHQIQGSSTLLLLNTLDPANPYGTFFPLSVVGARKVQVRTWNRGEVHGLEIEKDLEQIGFTREDQGMIHYRRY